MDFEAVKKTVGDRSFTLIDMRTPKEVEELGRIPGGRNLPCGFTKYGIRKGRWWRFLFIPFCVFVNASVAVKEIHSALSLEEEEFRSKYHFAKPGRADAIVAYCQIGGRSKKGAEALKVAGYTNVRVCYKEEIRYIEKKSQKFIMQSHPPPPRFIRVAFPTGWRREERSTGRRTRKISNK